MFRTKCLRIVILISLLFISGLLSISCGRKALTTEIQPSGAGSVTPSKGSYDKGVEVAVTANAAAGYRFDHWEGSASGAVPSIRLVMDGNKKVIAYFKKIYTLTVSSSPTGSGTVSPGSRTYDEGQSVTLVATPSQYYEFNRWAGDSSGSSDHLTITMNSDKTIVASFSKIMYSLEARVSPPSGGTVEPIRGTYEAGTQGTTAATPVSGYRFDRWGGSGSGTSNNLKIMMDGNKTVTAYFIRVYTLTVSSSPSDGGTINPKGDSYDAGTKVNLSATPLFPYYLKNWIGADNNSTNPTTVTMNADTSVTAFFAPLPAGPTQKKSAVVTNGYPVGAPVRSVPIQLNQFEWVQGEIIWGTNTPNTPVRGYIQDPAGNMVKDFGSAAQTNFTFMAQTTGPYTVVFENKSIWWASYSLTYTIWGKHE